MKTIEEKARAYDSIIEKANKMHSENCEACRACIEELIPELKESEDEKMRKELIRAFKSLNTIKVWNGIERTDILAWLEKQGEQKASYTTIVKTGDGGINALVTLHIEMKTAEESLGIDSDTYNKIVDECIFGEQKPVDKIEPKFKVGDKIYLKPEYRMPNDDTPIANTVKEIRRIDDKHYRFDGSYIFIEDQEKYELVEQKPAWSEEDERLCQCLIEDQEEALDNVRNDKYGHSEIISDLKEMYHERIDWLKSLKGRVQPKQEWNEEDEQHIDSLLKRLDALCRNKFERTRFAFSEDRDWLKSLRPQNNITDEELTQAKKNAYNDALDKIEYHSGEPTFDDGWSAAIDYIRKKSIRPQNKWKPSDEQIKVCKEVYADLLSAKGFDLGTVVSELNRMEEQLKKLKEGKV